MVSIRLIGGPAVNFVLKFKSDYDGTIWLLEDKYNL